MSIHETPAAPEAGTTIEVVIDGRPYRLVLGASNCVSLKHRHSEPHADGTDGSEPHHHHDAGCADLARQGTLYPAWETTPRHAHVFDDEGDGKCACGAYREPVEDYKKQRPGHVMTWYEIPPDDKHPEGWTYERWEQIAQAS